MSSSTRYVPQGRDIANKENRTDQRVTSDPISEQNKRIIPRNEFFEPVQLSLLQEKSGILKIIEKRSQGIDISSQGLGILTRSVLKKGDVLKVSLPARTDGTFLPVFSQVVWARQQDKEYRAGLQFLS